MNVRLMAGAALIAAATIAAPAAQAATFSFNGTRQNVNLLNPPATGRCAPLNTVSIAPGALSSTGASNFGGFASTQSHCIPGAPSMATPVQPVSDGQFVYDFGDGRTLTGIYSGMAVFDAGVVTGFENLIVQGGTGGFLGATGFINSVGNLRFAPNPQGPGFVGIFDGTVTGELNLPNYVPEPGTWAMLILGFGAIGAVARRRSLAAATA